MDTLQFQPNMASRHFSSSPKTLSALTPTSLSTATLSSRNLFTREIWGWVNSRHVISSTGKEMRGINVRAEMFGHLKFGLESAWNNLKQQEALPDLRRPILEADVSPQAVGERGVLIERRNMVTSMVLGIIAGAIWSASEDDGFAVAAQFTDMPAIRGKDYGKTKMRYPDYTETESGLQYKVIHRHCHYSK